MTTSERAHSKAIIDAISQHAKAFTRFEANRLAKAGTLPEHYALVDVSRGAGGSFRACGGRASYSWRVSVTCVGTTYLEAAWVREQVEKAIADKRIPAIESDAITLETETVIGPDDNLQSGVTDWVYHSPI